MPCKLHCAGDPPAEIYLRMSNNTQLMSTTPFFLSCIASSLPPELSLSCVRQSARPVEVHLQLASACFKGHSTCRAWNRIAMMVGLALQVMMVLLCAQVGSVEAKDIISESFAPTDSACADPPLTNKTMEDGKCDGQEAGSPVQLHRPKQNVPLVAAKSP